MEFFHYHIKKIEQQEDKDKRDLFLSFPQCNLFLRYNAQGKINWVFRERENVEEFNRWIEQDNVLLFSILKTIYRNENIIKFILFDLKHKYPFLQKKKKENHWRNTRQIILDLSSTQFNTTMDRSRQIWTRYPRRNLNTLEPIRGRIAQSTPRRFVSWPNTDTNDRI